MVCPKCGTENPDGNRFCGACGSPLARVCPSCGSPNAPGFRFCGKCGASLATEGAATSPTTRAPDAPISERRLVSVLFADLVGFTSLSESRDAEEVRDLLTRYFEACRKLVARYGGAIEKFIGDAVMAVWGTPVAQEDDAERAVRAGLDLTATTMALGTEVQAPDLRARVGVLTGEAAVTIGAEGQGMVAGDLVNTASRIQSTAVPGSVLVGEATKRATEAAVVYEDAGAHGLKGKADPVPLWRAVRVVGLRGGALKSAGLEPPFVGRDRELHLIKELFHAAAEERKAHLVSVVGVGGIGKTRLSWEFEKYIDGLAEDVWWHRGRCLAYGDGVAFWALAEMVRMRAGITEEEQPAPAIAKLREVIRENIPDPEEQRYVEPRLAHLLGLEDRGPGDQENLFAAWRLFFERLADSDPVILLFEDVHWADSALLDFIEYLLEWSRDLPLFVATLARPELTEIRPTWGAGARGFTSLSLEPLPREAMDELLTGPVPGLSEELRAQILERAEGVPFYAVETVRMLLDRGLLVREGNAYRTTGPIDTLEVPESLHALIAARLDGLAAEERQVIQDASVLGKTFFKQGVADLSGLPEDTVQSLLDSLVHKEVLSIQADPRSPERGQYGFLQDLVRKVAYETLAKKTRRTKHIAAAEFIERTWTGEEDEFAAILAAHYLDAYRAVPDAPDAHSIEEKARGMVVRAAERAASLGATAEAQRYFEHAIELTDDPLVQAGLHERAGIEAWAGARQDDAGPHYEQAMSLFEAADASHAAARVSARLAEVMWQRGRLENAVEMMDRSFQVLAKEEADEDLAWVAAQVSRLLYFAGEIDLSAERIETALDVAEALGLPEVHSQALNTKSLILASRGRAKEGEAILSYALSLALQHDKPSAALRAYNNLVDFAQSQDRYREAERYRQDGLALAHRVGDHLWGAVLGASVYPQYAMGQWDGALSAQRDLTEHWGDIRAAVAQGLVANCVAIHIHRGHLEEAERIIATFAELEGSSDVQERAEYAAGESALLLAQGRTREALRTARVGVEVGRLIYVNHMTVKESFVTAAEAAFQLDDLDEVDELLRLIRDLSPAHRPLFLLSHASRWQARLAWRRGHDAEVEPGLAEATRRFREIGLPFWTAVTLLEHAEWLGSQTRLDDAKPLLDEARRTFEDLEAVPWLERLERTATPAAATTA